MYIYIYISRANNYICIFIIYVPILSVHISEYLSLCRILAAVRNLLSLIPINQKTIESLEVFVHPVPDEGASEDHRSSFLSPQAVLNEFYDSSRVSPSQLLYNMEVIELSSQFLI